MTQAIVIAVIAAQSQKMAAKVKASSLLFKTEICENTKSESLDPSIGFLHDFTLSVIDMHQKRSISPFPTTIGHFHFYPFPRLI